MDYLKTKGWNNIKMQEPGRTKMKIRTLIILVIIYMMPVSLFSAEYGLKDLFRVALQNSEKIQYSQENLNIARIGKAKAISVLIPKITGYGQYTEYKSNSCT